MQRKGKECSCRGGGMRGLKANTPESNSERKEGRKRVFNLWDSELGERPTRTDGDDSESGHKVEAQTNSPFLRLENCPRVSHMYFCYIYLRDLSL